MPWRPPHHPRLLLLPTSCLWLEEEELCLHSDQSCIIFQSTTHYTDRCWRGKNNKDHNGKKEEVRRVAYDEERSDFSSDISQWLIPPSVDNQSQNAPSAISSILFVCLPVNQLGNQHRNHNQQRLLYIWIVPFFFSPHMHDKRNISLVLLKPRATTDQQKLSGCSLKEVRGFGGQCSSTRGFSNILHERAGAY